MKKQIALIFCALFLLSNFQLLAKISPSDTNKDTLTVTFKVNGLQACKTNIESLLSSQPGVISVDWNTQNKNMTVVFKSNIIKASEFFTILAMAGYDSSELRAKQPAYDALSAECKYTRDPETE